MIIINQYLNTRSKLNCFETIIIEFKKNINEYSDEEIIDFICKNIPNLNEYAVITAVEREARIFYRHKFYMTGTYSLEQIIEEAKLDKENNVTRFYFYKDSLDLLRFIDILAEWKNSIS